MTKQEEAFIKTVEDAATEFFGPETHIMFRHSDFTADKLKGFAVAAGSSDLRNLAFGILQFSEGEIESILALKPEEIAMAKKIARIKALKKELDQLEIEVGEDLK